MRFCIILLVPVSLLLGGCLGQRQLIDEQAQAIDSLYVVERNLRGELYALQDSIGFYEDIDSGRYYRDLRVLNDRITQLEYELAVAADSMCLTDVIETLLVDDLFEPASATLTEEGVKELAALAERLKTEYPDRRMRIEGHSDNVPLGNSLKEKYASNWELSAARAGAVVRRLIEEHEIKASQLEVVALGDSQPVASNATARGRLANRRIRVVTLPE